VVIRNAPFLDDGTPMPTRYWLVGKRERELVGRLESSGGVARAEAEVDPIELARAHQRYGAERDAAIPANHAGPLPSGGVGGTRVGVKCLHAHLAWYLAGGSDPVGRWVVGKLRGELEGAVAAIDCGTNSTRLLVVDRSGETIERTMVVTRLGEGVDERHRLLPEAIERTLVVLRSYRERMDLHGVVNVRATATSAARDADNSAQFFDAAETILGVRPELLAGDEEGALSYRGATSGLVETAGPFLVCDLGGGSTELIAGADDATIAAVISLNVGCVRISERFLLSDPPSSTEIDSARTFVRAQIEAAIRALPGLVRPRVMVGVAGTVSTLAALHLGLVEYDRDALHHQRLTSADVEGLFDQLSSMPLARRRALPGIEPGRADVIVGGALVLTEVMAGLHHDELIYSEDDILDGLIASMRVPLRA
jgi:exopolyphosphatase/guanosine-5'-triphosphate,3'-diphosphate pyrophosphatase